jgi:hypothetical protein
MATPVVTIHNTYLVCEQGLVTLSYEFYNEQFCISQGEGYDYFLNYGISVERAADILKNYGFDDSELFDVVTCMNEMYKQQNAQDIV